MRPRPEPAGPGQESVWAFPRPAVAGPSARYLRIEHQGVAAADTRAAVRTLELSQPPSWYVRPGDAPFAILRDHLAFYAGPFDRCTLDGEPVRAQPGGFCGGWVTADLGGPFKGVPGSMGW